MGILRDFQCYAHGVFESSEEAPLCPQGCDTVERVFLQPPAFNSTRTQNIDRTLESLAKSHGMSDIGPAAIRRKQMRAEQEQQRFAEFCQRRYGGIGWGDMPQGGNLNVQTKKIDGSGPGALGAVQSAGATGSVDLEASRPMLEAARKPVLVRRDHENLQVDVSKAA